MNIKHNIEITPRIGCKNYCEYCPQSTLIKRYRERIGHDKDTMMTLETFKKCLSTIPLHVGLNFTGYVEPFLNPVTPDMLLHAYERGYSILLNTTLVGLKKDDWMRVKDINFRELHIHLPSGAFDEMIGVQIPVEVYEENGRRIKKLSEEYYDMLNFIIQNPGNGWGQYKLDFHCLGDLHPELNDLRNYFYVGERQVNSRAMNILLEKKGKVPPDQNIRGNCSRVYQNVLLPDGSLSLCCQDYGLDEVLGNLVENTWEEYENSETVKRIRKEGADLCDYCEEGLHYTDDADWQQWRRPAQLS
tara:strand:+ start:9082 stop:9987 length:906 start_codon:yes stop_codon:yes gene_type:complete